MVGSSESMSFATVCPHFAHRIDSDMVVTNPSCHKHICIVKLRGYVKRNTTLTFRIDVLTEMCRVVTSVTVEALDIGSEVSASSVRRAVRTAAAQRSACKRWSNK